MDLKRTNYCNEIMQLLAKTLSVHTVSCVHQTNNGIRKTWLDENLLSHDDGIISTSEIEKRKRTKNKRTSWETTDNRDSVLFEDQNLTLCIRHQSPIDNLDDLYYVTVRPTLGSLNIMVSGGYETKMSVQDKEIIAALCYSVTKSLVDILRQSESKTQMLIEYIKHKDRTISAMKREMEIPADKTMKVVKEKLVALGRQFGKDFSLTKDAEAVVSEYAGDNMEPLINALERAASFKAEVYDNSQIEIDDTDILVKHDAPSETSVARQESVLEKRHSKIIAYLERLEDAYNTTKDRGQRPTAVNIAEALGVSSASITMWFKKHSEDARRLCEANINLCANTRRQFEPLKEAIAGKRNIEKSA